MSLANCLSASVTKHRSASSNKFRSPLGAALSALKLRFMIVVARDASRSVDSNFANPIGRNEEIIAHRRCAIRSSHVATAEVSRSLGPSRSGGSIGGD